MTETTDPDVLTPTAQGRLKSFIDRLERLEEDRKAVLSDVKEVFAELKGEGFDPKIVRAVLKLRGEDKVKRQEREALVDLYMSALGELPLFAAAAAPRPIVTLTVVTPTPAPAGDDEALYAKAVEIVTRDRKASTSYVQRRLQLGYNKAACLIERMEREGVVGPPDHAGKREILKAA